MSNADKIVQGNTSKAVDNIQGNGDPVGKLYDVFNSKSAPAQIGKPVFESDLEYAKFAGARGWTDILGKRIEETDKITCSNPINFGLKSHTLNVGMPNEVRLRLFQLKKLVSMVEIQAGFMNGGQKVGAREMQATPLYKTVLEPMLKAFNITDFSNFIDQTQARFHFEEFEIPLILADQFDTMPMDSPLVRVPGVLGKLFGRLETDSATFAVQSNTQDSYLVESKNNVVHTEITQDLLSDSAPAIIGKLQKEVLMGVARSLERTWLDGDVAVTHQDTDVTAATDYRKAWDGLRRRVFVADAALGAGALIFDNAGDSINKDCFSELLLRLKCQTADKKDLVYIMGCTSETQLITGAIPELFTALNFGALASNVTGEVPPVFGVRPIVSEHVREDLAATGKYSGAGTLTYMLLAQKSRYTTWVRQAARVWAAPSLPSSDFMLMSAKARHAGAGIPMGAGRPERNVAMAINIKTV